MPATRHTVRSILIGLCAAAVACSTITACGSSTSDGSDRTPPQASSTTAPTPQTTGTTASEPQPAADDPSETTPTSPTTQTAPTTSPPTTTATTEAPRERSSFDLGTLTCSTTGSTYILTVRAFNGSIFAVDQDFQTYAYEISEQIGEYVARETYPQLDPARPEFNQGTVDALRAKGEPYLCEAGD